MNEHENLAGRETVLSGKGSWQGIVLPGVFRFRQMWEYLEELGERLGEEIK